MNDRLKPCPFCGSSPESGVDFYESSGSNVKLYARVFCKKCHIDRGIVFEASSSITTVPFHNFTDAFSVAINRWNERCDNDGTVDGN